MLDLLPSGDDSPLWVWLGRYILDLASWIAIFKIQWWSEYRATDCPSIAEYCKTQQSPQDIGFWDGIVIHTPNPFISHGVGSLVIVMGALFGSIEPFPLDSLDIHHLE